MLVPRNIPRLSKSAITEARLGAKVLALESIADELVAKVVKGVEGLTVGKPEVGAA